MYPGRRPTAALVVTASELIGCHVTFEPFGADAVTKRNGAAGTIGGPAGPGCNAAGWPTVSASDNRPMFMRGTPFQCGTTLRVEKSRRGASCHITVKSRRRAKLPSNHDAERRATLSISGDRPLFSRLCSRGRAESPRAPKRFRLLAAQGDSAIRRQGVNLSLPCRRVTLCVHSASDCLGRLARRHYCFLGIGGGPSSGS